MRVIKREGINHGTVMPGACTVSGRTLSVDEGLAVGRSGPRENGLGRPANMAGITEKRESLGALWLTKGRSGTSPEREDGPCDVRRSTMETPV